MVWMQLHIEFNTNIVVLRLTDPLFEEIWFEKINLRNSFSNTQKT